MKGSCTVPGRTRIDFGLVHAAAAAVAGRHAPDRTPALKPSYVVRYVAAAVAADDVGMEPVEYHQV